MVPHPSNGGAFRPTPHLSRSREPTGGEIATYQSGPDRFPNLGHLGGFRTWRLDGLYPGVIISPEDFNCIGWSVGHTDRWIEGGSVEVINDLYRQYHFEPCQPADANVEVYRILDAPAMLTNHRGTPYANRNALVMHAHRRDHPHLDNPNSYGCSSKLRDGPLIAHNRWALVDDRSYNARGPRVSYGSIYQYWRRTPEHPSFPNKEANLVAATGNYPGDPVFAYGYGRVPAGHPGNNIGLPPGNNQAPQPGSGGQDNNAKKSKGWFSKSKDRTAKGVPLQNPPQGPKNFTYGAGPVSQPSYSPRQKYAQVSRMRAYDPIPLPSKAAWNSALQTYKDISKSSPKLVKAFEARFSAWKKSWYLRSTSISSSAKSRCYVDEFYDLLEMGPRIRPLVVYRLLDRTNFTAVFLYNALENDTRFLIDPNDVLNFLVLQRQSNLIVDINNGRRW